MEMNIKKIIDGLYFTVGMMLFNPATGVSKTPDELNEDDRYTYDACMGAIELMKEQEPRVMTLGNLRDIGSVWELNTPPYLWMEINPSYRWTRGFWVAWREIYDMIDGLHPTYDADNYGKTWRCRTLRPTVEQMNNTPWEERDNGEKAEY